MNENKRVRVCSCSKHTYVSVFGVHMRIAYDTMSE